MSSWPIADYPVGRLSSWSSVQIAKKNVCKPTEDKADRRKNRLAEERPVQVSGLLTFDSSAAVFFSTPEVFGFFSR